MQAKYYAQDTGDFCIFGVCFAQVSVLLKFYIL